MKPKIIIKSLMKHGHYEIQKVEDASDPQSWYYVLCYDGRPRKKSYDLDRLKHIAINDLSYLAN